jgi:uncharacterized membrane protein
MNLVDILIIAVIAVAVFFAVRHVVKLRKSGGCACGSSGGCSCGCAGCDKPCGKAGKK